MIIYKVFEKVDYDLFVANRTTLGSVVDKKDGFIHFSTRDQLCETIEKHFSGCQALFILAFHESEFGSDLKWEISRKSELFPHYYESLKLSSVIYSMKVQL